LFLGRRQGINPVDARQDVLEQGLDPSFARAPCETSPRVLPDPHRIPRGRVPERAASGGARPYNWLENIPDPMRPVRDCPLPRRFSMRWCPASRELFLVGPEDNGLATHRPLTVCIWDRA
jgi:hypothetical protein